MGRYFKIFPNWSQNWLKFNKICEEKLGDFAQYLAQNWFDWYMNGSLFLEKLVFVWVYFKFCCGTSLPKPDLSIPPPPPPPGEVHQGRGVRGIFFRGGAKSLFMIFFPSVKCFFPSRNFHFGRPQTISVVSKSKKQKQQSHLLIFILLFPFLFKVSTFPFTIFLLFFSIFPFFLASLLRVDQQKFSCEKCQGALCPPVTPLHQGIGLLVHIETTYTDPPLFVG